MFPSSIVEKLSYVSIVKLQLKHLSLFRLELLGLFLVTCTLADSILGLPCYKITRKLEPQQLYADLRLILLSKSQKN
jgi:hypothetical protein